MTGYRARNQVAIVGCAMSEARRRPTEPLGVTAVRTARAAIADAGLTVDRIDGFTSTSLFPSSGDHASVDGLSIVSSGWLARHLGAKPAYIAGYEGMGSFTGSIQLAVNALVSGSADYVLIHRALHNPAGKYHNTRTLEFGGDEQWIAPQGFYSALPGLGLVTTEYNHRYGGTREAMGRIAVEARKNGARNTWSHWYGKPITLEHYLAQPMISDPMSMLDCDIPVEAVGAFVLTTAERARDLPNRPVYIAGAANGYPRDHRLKMHWTLDEIMAAGRDMADRLWASAGMGRGDIDLPQFYDAFSPFVYIWLEALGFCGEGEAHALVSDGGIDSDRPGSLPVVSGGGALGNGRLHGLPQVLECYRQLAGRVGERQRQVETALATYSSPHYGGAIVFTNNPAS